MKPSKETRCAEGRDRPEGIPRESVTIRTQSRGIVSSRLARVNEVARRDKGTRFTALLHHVDVAALDRAFRRIRRRASAGVDGETVESYERELGARLRDLHDRLHTGRYRPQPVRRVYIPKADGGQRPLGVPTLEDKIVQGAVAEVLSSIYEADFIGFSYGFRPGRSPHHALMALREALMTQYVNWVLDADIRSFFDSVDHEWLLRMIAHRVADQRILQLIRRWLKAGILESGEWKESESGTPQGAGISPLLANIFLHYVLDLWAQQWRRRHAGARVILVRYADDFVLGFQSETDARRMLADLKQRLAKFGLTLHEDKTRLLEFGKIPAEQREVRGQRRPETFTFLGFTHYCGKTRDGRFVVKCKTDQRRLTRKLNDVRHRTRELRHAPLSKQHVWLCQVLRGHDAYYGLPGNSRALAGFHQAVQLAWRNALRRRGARCGLSWPRFNAMLARFPLPPVRTTHTHASLLAGFKSTLGTSRVRETRMLGSVRAKPNG